MSTSSPGTGSLDFEKRVGELEKLSGKVSFHPINEVLSFTSTTSVSNCGGIAIPANSYFVLTALATYINSKPQVVIIADENGAITQVSVDNTLSSQLSGTASGYTQEGTTIVFQAKYTGANENRMKIRGFYITVEEDATNE